MNDISTETPQDTSSKSLYQTFFKFLPAVFLAGVLLGGGVFFANQLNPGEVTFQELGANFAYDIEDREQSLEWADEVVVVKVDRMIRSFEDDFGFPRTTYEATVHRSLDSTYERGQVISLQQEGGFIGDEIFVIEGEELLTPNRAYVLAGKIGDDGTFFVQAGVSTQDVRKLDSRQAEDEFEKWGELGKPGRGRGLGLGQGNGQGNNGNGNGNGGSNR